MSGRFPIPIIFYYLGSLKYFIMKNKRLIIITSFLAVLICLIMIMLLFFAVTPGFLIILSLTIGIVTGVCITSLAYNLTNMIKIKKSENEK